MKNQTLSRSKYSIGKFIFGNLYVHRTYVDQINDDIIRSNIQMEMKKAYSISYDVIRYDTKTKNTTFIKVNDFNNSHEPLPDEYITFLDDDTYKISKGQQIWHHKWMMVGDDYMGFDVEQSKQRSNDWIEKIKHLDYKRIGRPEYWDLKLKAYGLEPRKVGI